jgi:hypothetical protein
MYVEIVASPTSGGISTRGEAIPEGDFQAPLLNFGAILLAAAVLLFWLLRRRRRQKLEVWHRRNLDMGRNGTGTQFDAVSGMRAPAQEADSQS